MRGLWPFITCTLELLPFVRFAPLCSAEVNLSCSWGLTFFRGHLREIYLHAEIRLCVAVPGLVYEDADPLKSGSTGTGNDLRLVGGPSLQQAQACR